MAGTKKEKLTKGSGNVFVDIGSKDPKEALAKAELVRAIATSMAAKGLTQTQLGHVVDMHQSEVSRLLRGLTSGFSTERLIGVLRDLGNDVSIRVVPRARNVRGGLSVERIEDSLVARERAAGYGVRKAKKGPNTKC